MVIRPFKKGYRSRRSNRWVGDGFPINRLMGCGALARELNPFILLDHVYPTFFDTTSVARGVAEHPHRGIEFVTLQYEGGLIHRNSLGETAELDEMDAQWVTAGSGLCHEEYHSEDFSREGGAFHLVHLWINLPAAYKMTAPAHRLLPRESQPVVPLCDELSVEQASVRVIAGSYRGHKGPAQPFSPMNIWGLRLEPEVDVLVPVPDGWVAALLCVGGKLQVSATDVLYESNLATFEQSGTHVRIRARKGSYGLLLAAEPLNEPFVRDGGFVMNTEEELARAKYDFERGRFAPVLREAPGDRSRIKRGRARQERFRPAGFQNEVELSSSSGERAPSSEPEVDCQEWPGTKIGYGSATRPGEAGYAAVALSLDDYAVARIAGQGAEPARHDAPSPGAQDEQDPVVEATVDGDASDGPAGR